MGRISRIAAYSTGPISPTPEMCRRHRVEKPQVDGKMRREAYQVVPRVYRMMNPVLQDRSSGPEITVEEYEAALRWRDDYELSEGARIHGTLRLGRVDGGRSNDGITATQIGAMARIRAVRNEIGPAYHALLLWSVVLDNPWLQIGQLCSGISTDRRGVSHHTAKSWCADAIRALAAYYDKLDGVDRARRRAQRTRTADFE